MDNLVAELNTSNQQRTQGVNEGSSSRGSTANSKSQTTFLSRDSSDSGLQVENELEILDASSIRSETPGTELKDNTVDLELPDLHQAEELLTIFRRDFCPEFPFVLLSPDETSKSLSHDKPFLFLSIVAVTSYANPQLQRRLGREIMNQIASRMIIKNEKGLDLLQGLLVYLAWYHYSLQDGPSQILLSLQLCVNLVSNMGLMRDYANRLTTKRDQVVEAPEEARSSPEQFLSELRAFLGTFYLCSG